MTLALEYATPDEKKPMRTVWNVLFRLMLGFAGIAIPIISFCMANRGFVGPDWQSKAWFDQPSMLLWHSVGWPIYPLNAFAMLGMVCGIISPRWAARRSWCQFAVATGIVLSLVYLILLVIAVEKPYSGALWTIVVGLFVGILAPSGVLLLIALIWWITNRWGTLRTWLTVTGGLIAIPLVVAGVVAIFQGFRQAGEILSICAVAPFVGCLFGGPSLSLAAYSVMACQLWQEPGRKRLPVWLNLAGWIIWFSGLAATWKIAAGIAVREYAKLPTTDPSCYIATAAARGHCRWVKSQAISVNGVSCMVNDQLRYCKAFELMLRGMSPRAHRAVRAAYDLIGPVAARMLCTPLLADTAYLALKPAEYLGRIAVRWAGVARDVARFYPTVEERP